MKFPIFLVNHSFFWLEPHPHSETAGQSETTTVGVPTGRAGQRFERLRAEVQGNHHFFNGLPSGYVKIAIENGHLKWIFPLKMVIFHSYVSLPEGKTSSSHIFSMAVKLGIPTIFR